MAIPAKIVEIKEDNLAIVDILGATREISLDLTPSAEIGSHVLVHAGFAIEIVDEQFAQETIDLIRQFPELAEDDVEAIANQAREDEEIGDTTGVSSMQSALSALADEL